MLARMPKSAQPPAEIAATIRVVRGQRVLIDSDLAELYGVSTRRLNEQVRRQGRPWGAPQVPTKCRDFQITPDILCTGPCV